MDSPENTLESLPEEQSRAAAAIVLKLSRALPRHAGPHTELFAQFQSLVLRIASLLPSHEASGLGDVQVALVKRTLDAMLPIARQAVVAPLHHMSPAMHALLRELAVGSEAQQREWGNCASATTLKTTRYAVAAVDWELVPSVAKAELAYETLLNGVRYLATMNHADFFASVDAGLWSITSSVLFWAPPLLFDGLRLRRGLEVASSCGIPFPGQRAPFGLDGSAARFLSDGETTTDRERVGRAAQFFLAASSMGWKEYHDCSFSDEAAALRQRITTSLKTCREEHEQRSPMPGKSMRIILDTVATSAEHATFDEASFRMFQLAFGFPCLCPLRLRPLKGYDKGLLSVWDACNHLIRLFAQENQVVLSIHGALCAVLGGVVGSIMSGEHAGPFFVAHKGVADLIEEMQQEWPPSRLAPSPTRASCARTVLRAEQRGKMVSATAAVCEAIRTNVYKAEPKPSALMRARFEAAFSMLVVADTLRGCWGSGVHGVKDVHDSRPTDGIVGLKRLYFVALHHEPWLPEGRKVEHRGHACWETSPLSDGQPAAVPCAIAQSSIEVAWREIVGGACLATGPLFAFTQRGLSDSLMCDWKPLPAVQQALSVRSANTSSGSHERSGPVMLPSVAMIHATERAKDQVVRVVNDVDNLVKSSNGPAYVTRVLDFLNVWALSVYPYADYNPLWESVIMHFCPMAQLGKKRARNERGERGEAVLQDGKRTISTSSLETE